MPPIFRIFSFDNGEPLRGTEIYTKYPKKNTGPNKTPSKRGLLKHQLAKPIRHL